MSDFELAVKTAAEKAVLHYIQGGNWLQPDYATRLKVPAEWLTEAWKMVDRDKLQKQLAEKIEAELAERIISAIAAELASDIKQILSVKERREAIRALARDHMTSIMKAGT